LKKNNNISSSVTMNQLLEFEVAFPEEITQKPEEYLKGGSREYILQAISFLLGIKSLNSKYHDNKELLQRIFGSKNKSIINYILNKINAAEQNGVKIRIINTYSSLRIFEFFFSRIEGYENQTQSDEEFEINFFKAYLIFNSEFTKKQEQALVSTEHLDKDLKIPMMLFCMHYPLADKENYKIYEIWASQIIKAIYLFKFLETNSATGYLINKFIEYYNCESWKEYLKRILPITIPCVKKEKETYTDILIEKGEGFSRDCEFIEKIILHQSETFADQDFIALRKNPVYKVDKGRYRIIFDLFLIEKIFKGVYFLLADINDKLPKKNKLKEFRSIYGYTFSENILCYNVIKSIYTNKCTQFSGKELDDMKIIGAPDYYVRKGNNILIFESKDFLIRADKKFSFDYNVYDTEFQKKLYFEELPSGEEKHKAVMQLIANVRRILKMEFKADKTYNFRKVSIYPILLTHDHQYDCPGFNNLIDSWFQDELFDLKNEGIYINNVKPLTVINIDSLIYNQVGLSEKISLHEVISSYHKFLKSRPVKKFKNVNDAEGFILSRIVSFYFYINNFFHKYGVRKFPQIIDLLGPELFEEEYLDRKRRNELN
jgi:hypothetical protein